jgi:hypothetical protein
VAEVADIIGFQAVFTGLPKNNGYRTLVAAKKLIFRRLISRGYPENQFGLTD